MYFPDDIWNIVKEYLLESKVKRYFKRNCLHLILGKQPTYIISTEPDYNNTFNGMICVKTGYIPYCSKNNPKHYNFEFMTVNQYRKYTFYYLNCTQFRYHLKNQITRT